MNWKPEAPPELQPGEKVAIDYEYRGDPSGRTCSPFAVSVWSPARNRGWYLPWGHEGGGNMDEATIKRWFQHELRDRDCYGLNIKADLHATAQWGIDAEDQGMRPHDVGHMSALLQENRMSAGGWFGFSLEALAEHYLPAGERKVHPVGYAPQDFWQAPADAVAERGISDAFLTWRLHETLTPDIEAQGLEKVLALEDRCIYPTVGMERNGFRLDRARLEQWNDSIPVHAAALRAHIHAETGIDVNPRGPKSLAQLFAKLGLDAPEMYDEKKQQWRVTYDAEHMAGVDHPLMRSVLALRKLQSLGSRFVTKYLGALDADNKIHYQLHQLRTAQDGIDKGTVTGRYSSGGGEHKINIQQVAKSAKQEEDFESLNIPPDYIVRQAFLPDEGMLLAASDASQIEFRMFAHYSRNDALIEAYRRDPRIDFHMLVTRMMAPGVTDEAVLKKLRKHYKQNNFGTLYGMGRAKLAVRLGMACTCGIDWRATGEDGFPLRVFSRQGDHSERCPARQANKIMDEYHAEFPSARDLLRRAGSLAETQGYVCTYLGRRRRYPTKYKLHSALNAVIQGTAADYFKTKLVRLWGERKRLGITLRAVVHDEFVFDVPDVEHLAQAHRLLAECEWPDFRVPLLWDTGYGPNWASANE